MKLCPAGRRANNGVRLLPRADGVAVALAVLISLVQVAGPLVGSCCCRPAPSAAVAVVPAEPPACPHCPRPPASTPDDLPAKPCPHGPQPCCLKVAPVADVPARPAAEWDRLLAVASDGASLLTPAIPAAVPIDLAAWAAGRAELPFLPTSVRLYVHHALLC